MAAFRRPLGQPFWKTTPTPLDPLPSTGATPDTLVPQYDYPLPQPTQFPTSGRSGYNNPLPAYAAVTQVIRQNEWPVPQRVPFRPDSFVYPNLVILQTPTVTAVSALVGQYDYPLPPPPIIPISTRTWINPSI